MSHYNKNSFVLAESAINVEAKAELSQTKAAPQSATRAANLGAKAFASGENIYFNQGEYSPGTTAGRHLIAHELTHVKQQRTIPGLQYRLAEPAARDRYEQEADAVVLK